MVCTTLAHLMDVDFLREAYRRTRTEAAPGSDGVTAATSAEHLEANLIDLYKRLRSGRSTAPPVKRTWLDKEDGSQRPIGMPVMHDRAAQGLAKLAREHEWEATCEPNSYGFRPGRSRHDAIEAIHASINQQDTYVLDADMAKCFDRIDHQAL